MSSEAATAWADNLIFNHTGTHLTELQVTILQQVWQGKRYLDIALHYGCTEGHAKDTGSDLWKLLSDALGEKVSKRNFIRLATHHSATLPVSLSPSPPAAIDENVSFIGRSQAIEDLRRLEKNGSRAILIQGEGGIGKTTLAQQYLHSQAFEQVLELLVAKDLDNITSAESVIEEWLRRDFNEEPGREFGVTLSRFQRHLQTQRIGILIDNLEPALDQSGRIVSEHRPYGELIRILADSRNQGLTLITSRDRLCEESVTLEQYRLSGLSVKAWLKFWNIHQIETSEAILTQIHGTYGGNAKAMQILSGIIHQDFGGCVEDYWQEAADDPLQIIALKNLVSSQIERLAELDPDAYRLLCRLSCYRFQEHSSLPKDGVLAQLWDVAASQQAQVIQSLRNRSLVEFHRGEYWLHPVIRADAIARLKQSGDWNIASRQAAQFWSSQMTVITNIQDALIAWEAFYHYLDIHDYEAASQVILKPYQNQWEQYLPLGSVLYRMGLAQLVVQAIHQIMPHLKIQSHISELNNILGDLYWITGNVADAIACQTTAAEKATACLDNLPHTPETPPCEQHKIYYFKMLKIDSLFSLGLYHIDLGELSEATAFFEQVIALGQQTQHERWAEKASICLAYVQSLQGQTDVLPLVQPIYEKVISAQLPAYTGPFAYFIQHLGQIYANCDQPKDARHLFETAIAYAQASQYTQVLGVCETGLAKLLRLGGKHQSALVQHQAAVKHLAEIGATCDLAEAHLQWGITLREMHPANAHQPPQHHFEQAIALFRKIGAPLQIQRVLYWEQNCQQHEAPHSG